MYDLQLTHSMLDRTCLLQKRRFALRAEEWMLQDGKYECSFVGKGRKRLSVAKPLACFILLCKRIQVHSHKYTTAVFKFIQHKNDKKEKVNKNHIYNILIITELAMYLLWLICIINFVDKTVYM